MGNDILSWFLVSVTFLPIRVCICLEAMAALTRLFSGHDGQSQIDLLETTITACVLEHTYLSQLESLGNSLQTFLSGALHRKCKLNKLPIEQLNPGDKTAFA